MVITHLVEVRTIGAIDYPSVSREDRGVLRLDVSDQLRLTIYDCTIAATLLVDTGGHPKKLG
jgi:hypothetical protein